MTQRKIEIMRCSCGHAGCSDYWLCGIGKFVQGSGFEKDEAQMIAALVNQHRTSSRRARRSADSGVPTDGSEAFAQGWIDSACPHEPMTVAAKRWRSDWWAANADAFQAHIDG